MNNNTEREFKEGTNKERKDMRYYQEKYFRFGVYVYDLFLGLCVLALVAIATILVIFWGFFWIVCISSCCNCYNLSNILGNCRYEQLTECFRYTSDKKCAGRQINAV